MRSKRWRERILFGLAACALIAAMFATYRKSALLAPVAVFLTLAYFRRRELLKLAPLGLVLVVIVSSLSPGALGSTVSQFIRPDRLSVPTVSDRSSDYDAVRPDVWTHVAFGRGWGSYDHRNYRILDSGYSCSGPSKPAYSDCWRSFYWPVRDPEHSSGDCVGRPTVGAHRAGRRGRRGRIPRRVDAVRRVVVSARHVHFPLHRRPCRRRAPVAPRCHVRVCGWGGRRAGLGATRLAAPRAGGAASPRSGRLNPAAAAHGAGKCWSMITAMHQQPNRRTGRASFTTGLMPAATSFACTGAILSTTNAWTFRPAPDGELAASRASVAARASALARARSGAAASIDTIGSCSWKRTVRTYGSAVTAAASDATRGSAAGTVGTARVGSTMASRFGATPMSCALLPPHRITDQELREQRTPPRQSVGTGRGRIQELRPLSVKHHSR